MRNESPFKGHHTSIEKNIILLDVCDLQFFCGVRNSSRYTTFFSPANTPALSTMNGVIITSRSILFPVYLKDRSAFHINTDIVLVLTDAIRSTRGILSAGTIG